MSGDEPTTTASPTMEDGEVRGGADDFRLLLTVIAGIALGVAAAAMPSLIGGPILSWTFAAKLVMWSTGIGAVVLFYLAVLFGSRLYFHRVDFVGTTSLVLVFLAQAGMFAALAMDDDLLGPRWFVMFALYNAIAGLDTEHARRVITRHAVGPVDAEVVRFFGRSLRAAVVLLWATGAASLLFIAIWPAAPPLALFLASCLALASVAYANVREHRARTKLAESGVI